MHPNCTPWPIEVRFNSKYVIDSETGCWNWTGPKNEKAYGRLIVRIDGIKKTVRAHRLSWRLHRGEIPDGLWVLHSCDNPSCVNPDHLWLGTHLENMADMRKKRELGTHPRLGPLTEDYVKRLNRSKMNSL